MQIPVHKTGKNYTKTVVQIVRHYKLGFMLILLQCYVKYYDLSHPIYNKFRVVLSGP